MRVDGLLGVLNMNDPLLQGEYADIIIELLREPYSVDSVLKIVFLAFCVRNESRSSYRNRRTDFVDVLLENLSIKFLSHPDELKCIFEVLNKLKRCGWISIKEGKIYLLKEFNKEKCDNIFLVGCQGKEPNPIIEVNKLDNTAFIEEVLRHV